MPPDSRFPIRPADFESLTAVLRRHAPRSFRIAAALTKQPEAVGAIVLNAACRQAGRWSDDADAARWFNHYTVLVARQFPTAEPVPDARFDRLLDALHALPRQQREAFVLHHAERMDLRQVATAMDCSASAAANHLVAATQLLRAVDEDQTPAFSAALPELIAKSSVSPEAVIEAVVRTAVRRRRLRRIARRGFVAFIIVAGAAVTWVLWRLFLR